MKRHVLAAVLLLLAGCTRESDELVAQFDMAEKTRELTPSEKCEWYSKIAAAYLKERNAPKYKDADLFARVYCANAELNRSM